MKEGDLEAFNLNLQKLYRIIQEKEERYEGVFLKDAQVVLVAYGTMARIAKGVVYKLREKGERVGLIRPVTLWPFPAGIIRHLAISRKRLAFLVIEMSYGQMVEDVRLSLNGKAKVEFLGRAGGGIPTEEEIISFIMKRLRYE